MSGCGEQCDKPTESEKRYALMVKRMQLAALEKEAAAKRAEVAELEAELSIGSTINEDAADSLVDKEKVRKQAQRTLDRQARDEVRSGWSHPPKKHRR